MGNKTNEYEQALKMICKVEKIYQENFNAQAELLKQIVNTAIQNNKQHKNIGLDERSFEDPFTFILDFLGRGNEDRYRIAKKILPEKGIENILFLGIQNLTRVKSVHLNKEVSNDECPDMDMQKCLKSIFWDENNSLKEEPDFEKLKNIFKEPNSTATSVLYWLYPEQYIPFDKNSQKLYQKLLDVEIKETWECYEKILNCLKKKPFTKEDNNDNFKPSMVIALSMVARLKQNAVENILHKIIGDSTKPKNIILTGIPGTGKTHTIMEYLKDNNEISGYEFVQFHPSYDYEDFIEGLKPIPSQDGQIKFKLVNGVFKELCKKAYVSQEKTYVMVIDEINRANLSRVFGELLYCLEYRGEFVSTKMTTYIQSLNEEQQKEYSISSEYIGKFAIPENVIVLGTMNEVDRSIDAFDLALRRRFMWEEIDFSEAALRLYAPFFEKNFQNNVEALISKAKKLNETLSKDIGTNYQLGHTYYFKIIDYFDEDFESALCDLWEYHLKSILKEYCKIKFGEHEINDKLKGYREIIIGEIQL